MRLLAALLLFAVASATVAGERERQRPPQQNVKQIGIQVAKAEQHVEVGGTQVTMPAGVKQNIPPVAPNPNAHPPSAQCRFGESATLGVQEFGFGYSGSFWDRICGLWLAAQQTTGAPSEEAATAAFCLTMRDAGVQSPTCVGWSTQQGTLEMEAAKRVKLNSNQATVVFGGASSGGWN